MEKRNLYFFFLNVSLVEFYVDMLIDGELVFDKVFGGGKELKFLVFDFLCLDGKVDLFSKLFDKWLGYFKEYVMKLYKKLFMEFL